MIKPNIQEFTETGVKFQDNTVVSNVDTVILATGYSIEFPYLEKGIIPIEENRVELYKYMYPPDLAHPTLAVVGLLQPIGAVIPMSELQCRLACEVLAGRKKLPSAAKMHEDVKKKLDSMALRYVKSRRHTIQVDYVQYMDELADQLGIRPRPWKYLLKDPRLAYHLWFGPCLPYHFRLEGESPHRWEGARDAIMSVWDRVAAPTQTRLVADEEKSSWNLIFLFVIAIGILIMLIYLGDFEIEDYY